MKKGLLFFTTLFSLIACNQQEKKERQARHGVSSIEKRTPVLISEGQYYHYSTICLYGKDSLYITNEYDAIEDGLRLCPECKDREDSYNYDDSPKYDPHI